MCLGGLESLFLTFVISFWLFLSTALLLLSLTETVDIAENPLPVHGFERVKGSHNTKTNHVHQDILHSCFILV